MKRKTSSGVSGTNAHAKKTRPGKMRLDALLVARGLASSRENAQALLLAGQVRVGGQPAAKPGSQVACESNVEIVGERLRYVGRGGLKLEGALEDFTLTPRDRICLDVGSSTGGFTDCLLQNGASKVYAVDVTIDQLDWKLRNDRRVIAIERNARFLTAGDVAEFPALVTMDVSFISVGKVVPAIVPIAAPGADFLVLIKPQFELDRGEVGKGGIVREASLHEKAIRRVREAAAECGLQILTVKPSRLSGAEGNREFFLHARKRQ
jgi:23S rRNA (cytidine1920-2'-O)/16S rRNA (cytidine1409-2'-O)-methyltransferase